MSCSSGLVVEGDRNHERACLRIVEVVDTARADDGPVPPAALAEGLHVARAGRLTGAGGAILRVQVGAVAPQRALGAVPDLAAVPDIEQARELELAVAERRPDAARPVVVRVLDNA